MDTDQVEAAKSVQEALEQLEYALAEAAQAGDEMRRLAALRETPSFDDSVKTDSIYDSQN